MSGLFYTDLHNYAYTSKRLSLEDLKTFDRLFDNATFVRIYAVERFSKDFLEMMGLRGRGSQLCVIQGGSKQGRHTVGISYEDCYIREISRFVCNICLLINKTSKLVSQCSVAVAQWDGKSCVSSAISVSV